VHCEKVNRAREYSASGFTKSSSKKTKKNYASAFLFDREKHLQIKTGCTVKECSPCKKLDPSPDLFGQQCYKNNKENTRGIEKRRRFVSG
jgi:hypothetical protein